LAERTRSAFIGKFVKRPNVSSNNLEILDKMKFYFTLLTFLIFTICNGQKSTPKYELDKKCYSLGQQQPLNACLSEKAEKLRKIVEEKYNCILNYLQKEIENCAKEKCEDLEYYTKHKNDLVSSQKAWRTLREKNSEFWSGGGGTITNQYIAESLIKDCKDRLTWLDNVIEEAGQGQTDILKCE